MIDTLKMFGPTTFNTHDVWVFSILALYVERSLQYDIFNAISEINYGRTICKSARKTIFYKKHDLVWDAVYVLLDEFREYIPTPIRDRFQRRAPTISKTRTSALLPTFLKSKSRIVSDALTLLENRLVSVLYPTPDQLQKTKSTLLNMQKGLSSKIPRSSRQVAEEEDEVGNVTRQGTIMEEDLAQAPSTSNQPPTELLSQIILRQQELCHQNQLLLCSLNAYAQTVKAPANDECESWLDQPCPSVSMPMQTFSDYFVGGPKFSSMSQIYNKTTF